MNPINRQLPPLTLEQIVRFCGAVQDFNPIHYDEAFARGAGLPGVIAQGPLTYLLALDALVADVGLPAIRGLQARLKAPVMAGMPMAISCDAQGKVSLTAQGTEALAGTAIWATGSAS
jgi:acyl dehydratase